MATQVIWSGNDEDGFYTSHLVTGSGRHTQDGHYGPPTGRTFASRTIADCMVYENKIYREWIVADHDGDPEAARASTRIRSPSGWRAGTSRRGCSSIDIGENRRLIGQYPPEAEPDLEIASTDLERETLRWLHEVFNKRMFGKIKDVYAPTVMYHGPLMAELYGVAAVMHQTIGLVGSLPDAAFMPQHICSVPCEEGGTKVAVRWIMEGHHLGYGLLQALGAPTGKRVQVMGMSHFHYKNGRIVDEWRVYDELSLLMQVKLAQMADAGRDRSPTRGHAREPAASTLNSALKVLRSVDRSARSTRGRSGSQPRRARRRPSAAGGRGCRAAPSSRGSAPRGAGRSPSPASSPAARSGRRRGSRRRGAWR